MNRTPLVLTLIAGCLAFVAVTGVHSARADYASHPPLRALPEPSSRPMGDGVAFFVDADGGADTNDGSEPAPWQTLSHAIDHLGPGVTLYLRGGIHWAVGE